MQKLLLLIMLVPMSARASDIWLRDLFHFDLPTKATGMVVHASATLPEVSAEFVSGDRFVGSFIGDGSALTGLGSAASATNQGAVMDYDFISDATGYLFKLSDGVYEATTETGGSAALSAADALRLGNADAHVAQTTEFHSLTSSEVWAAIAHVSQSSSFHGITSVDFLSAMAHLSQTTNPHSLTLDVIGNASTTFAEYVAKSDTIPSASISFAAGAIAHITQIADVTDEGWVNNYTLFYNANTHVFEATPQASGGAFTIGDHSVTELNDVTDAGSGKIITAAERTNGNAASAHVSQTTSAHGLDLPNLLEKSDTVEGASVDIMFGEVGNASSTLALYLPLNGGTMLGHLSMGAYNLTDVGIINNLNSYDPLSIIAYSDLSADDRMNLWTVSCDLMMGANVAGNVGIFSDAGLVEATAVQYHKWHSDTNEDAMILDADNADLTLEGDVIAARLTATATSSLATTEVVAANFASVFDNGNSGAAATVNWGRGNKQKITLSDNVTISFVDPGGPTNLLLVVAQDVGGGNAAWDWTADGSVLWAGSATPTITSDGSAIDIVTFFFDGSDYYGVQSAEFGDP